MDRKQTMSYTRKSHANAQPLVEKPATRPTAHQTQHLPHQQDSGGRRRTSARQARKSSRNFRETSANTPQGGVLRLQGAFGATTWHVAPHCQAFPHPNASYSSDVTPILHLVYRRERLFSNPVHAVDAHHHSRIILVHHQNAEGALADLQKRPLDAPGRSPREGGRRGLEGVRQGRLEVAELGDFRDADDYLVARGCEEGSKKDVTMSRGFAGGRISSSPAQERGRVPVG